VSTDGLPRDRRRGAGYLEALAAIAVASGVAGLIVRHVDPGTLTTTYLLAVVIVAARAGRGPAIVASIGSVAAFDFFFVPPYFTLVVAEAQYWLTFGVMLMVGLVVGTLTARIRRQADAAHRRERWTAALAAMNTALAGAGGIGELAQAAQRHLADLLGASVALLLPDAAGVLHPVRSDDRSAAARSRSSAGKRSSLRTWCNTPAASGSSRATLAPMRSAR